MPKYKKGEYRDQFIIAFIRDFNESDEVINLSKKLSVMLKKGLILLYIEDDNYSTLTVTQAQEKLQQLNAAIELPYVHSYAALKGRRKPIIESLGELLNGVIVVSKKYDTLLKDFASSRLAYFVFDNYNQDNDFKDVVLSMNALKECKEKILWASYFGRFASAVTHIFYHRYRDEYLQKQLCLNIGFLRKMFRKFNIETKNARTLNSRTMLDVQAMDYAKMNNCSLCIFQTTKNKSIIELFTGLSEKKVLDKLQSVPVLFLNRRDDLFVMCE